MSRSIRRLKTIMGVIWRIACLWSNLMQLQYLCLPWAIPNASKGCVPGFAVHNALSKPSNRWYYCTRVATLPHRFHNESSKVVVWSLDLHAHQPIFISMPSMEKNTTTHETVGATMVVPLLNRISLPSSLLQRSSAGMISLLSFMKVGATM